MGGLKDPEREACWCSGWRDDTDRGQAHPEVRFARDMTRGWLHKARRVRDLYRIVCVRFEFSFIPKEKAMRLCSQHHETENNTRFHCCTRFKLLMLFFSLSGQADLVGTSFTLLRSALFDFRSRQIRTRLARLLVSNSEYGIVAKTLACKVDSFGKLVSPPTPLRASTPLHNCQRLQVTLSIDTSYRVTSVPSH